MNNTACTSRTSSGVFPLSILSKDIQPESELIELPEAKRTVRQNLTYCSRRYPSSSIVLEKRIGYICKAMNLYGFMDQKYEDCTVAQKILAQKARRWIDSGEPIL